MKGLAVGLMLLAIVFLAIPLYADEVSAPWVTSVRQDTVLRGKHLKVVLVVKWKANGGNGPFLVQYAANPAGPWFNLVPIDSFKYPPPEWGIKIDWPRNSLGQKMIPIFVRAIRPPT